MLRYWTGTRPRSGEDSRITCEGRLEHRDLHLSETEGLEEPELFSDLVNLDYPKMCPNSCRDSGRTFHPFIEERLPVSRFQQCR